MTHADIKAGRWRVPQCKVCRAPLEVSHWTALLHTVCNVLLGLFNRPANGPDDYYVVADWLESNGHATLAVEARAKAESWAAFA